MVGFFVSIEYRKIEVYNATEQSNTSYEFLHSIEAFLNTLSCLFLFALLKLPMGEKKENHCKIDAFLLSGFNNNN